MKRIFICITVMCVFSSCGRTKDNLSENIEKAKSSSEVIIQQQNDTILVLENQLDKKVMFNTFDIDKRFYYGDAGYVE